MQQARGLSPLPQGEDNDAQLFAQSRMLRIRQLNGLYLSIVVSTSPLRAVASIPQSDFHGVSRAGGPKGQLTRPRGLPKYAEVVQDIVCCGLDCGLEKVHEFCGNPHSHLLEIRSSVRIILRRRFGKPQSRYLNQEAVWSVSDR